MNDPLPDLLEALNRQINNKELPLENRVNNAIEIIEIILMNLSARIMKVQVAEKLSDE